MATQSDLTKAIQELQHQITEETAHAAQLEQKLHGLEAEKVKLKAEIQTETQRVTAIEREIPSLQADIRKIHDEHVKKSEEVTKIQHEFAEAVDPTHKH